MSKLIVILFCILSITACTTKPSSKVLSIPDMKFIMWDMMNADNWYRAIQYKDSLAAMQQRNIQLYNKIFALHHTTRKQFYYSFTYYEANPVEMKVLLDSLDAYSARVRASASIDAK